MAASVIVYVMPRKAAQSPQFAVLAKRLKDRLGNDRLAQQALAAVEERAPDDQLALAMVLDVDAMKLDAFPGVDAYLKRLRARPSYRAISPHTKVAEASSHA